MFVEMFLPDPDDEMIKSPLWAGFAEGLKRPWLTVVQVSTFFIGTVGLILFAAFLLVRNEVPSDAMTLHSLRAVFIWMLVVGAPGAVMQSAVLASPALSQRARDRWAAGLLPGVVTTVVFYSIVVRAFGFEVGGVADWVLPAAVAVGIVFLAVLLPYLAGSMATARLEGELAAKLSAHRKELGSTLRTPISAEAKQDAIAERREMLEGDARVLLEQNEDLAIAAYHSVLAETQSQAATLRHGQLPAVRTTLASLPEEVVLTLSDVGERLPGIVYLMRLKAFSDELGAVGEETAADPDETAHKRLEEYGSQLVETKTSETEGVKVRSALFAAVVGFLTFVGTSAADIGTDWIKDLLESSGG